MKIARLLLVLLALTVTTLSAATKAPGSGLHAKGGGHGMTPRRHSHRPGVPAKSAAGGWWYYCYSDPGTVYTCDLGSAECQQECADTCGGICDWEEQAT